MKKPLLGPRQVLLIAVVLLLISSMLPARWARVVSNQPRQLLRAAVAPADHILKPLGDKLRRPPDLPVDLGNREEYERAKQQVIELQYRLSQANQRLAELSQIRSQQQLTGVGLLPATVIAWSADRLNPTLTINRGTRHSLAPGMLAVRGFQLVGRILNAGPVTATIGLITAPDTHLVVKAMPPQDQHQPRSLVVHLTAVTGKDIFWADTNAHDPIQIDDLAYLYDDAWPTRARGFVVGKITDIKPHPDDPILRRRITVTPTRSLPHLDYVTLIVPTSSP